MKNMGDQATLLDYWKVIRGWKRFILSFIVGVTTLVFVVSLFLPKKYKAYATLLPVLDQQSSIAATINIPGVTAGKSSEGVQQLLAIMGSRAMSERVAQEIGEEKLREILFDGEKGVGIPEMGAVLRGMVASEYDPGHRQLVIEALARRPDTAALVTNAYVEELGRFLNELSLGTNFIILDPALIPTAHFSPNIKKNVLCAVAFSWFGSLFFAFLAEYIRRLGS